MSIDKKHIKARII